MCEIAKVAKVSKCLLFLNYIKMKMVSCFDYYYYFFGRAKVLSLENYKHI